MFMDLLGETPTLGILTLPSPYSVEITLDRLQKEIKEKGLTLFSIIDHQAAAQKAGLNMEKATLLLFGNPTSGTPLMIASPLLALDLPLKVLVWQDKNTHIWVSYNTTAYISKRYAIPPHLVTNIAGISHIVANAVKR